MSRRIHKKVAVFLFATLMGLSVGQNADAAKYVKKVKVMDPVTNSTKVAYMAKGTKRKLYTTISVTKKKYNLSQYKMLTVSSNKPKIVSISKKGYLKAKKAGTAYVTVKSVYDSKKKKIKVVVKNGKVNNIILNRSALTLKMNTKKVEDRVFALTADVEATKEDATKNLLWTSSNDQVAVVDNTGKVSAVAPGQAVIIAKAIDGSGKKAKCNVEVLTVADKNTTEATTEQKTTEEKSVVEKKTVITMIPDAYININLTTKGDYRQCARELKEILESATKSGDQFTMAMDGKDYTVENVNGSMLISDGENKKHISEAIYKNVKDVSVCILYTEDVAAVVNNIDLKKLQGEYSFDYEMDHFVYNNLVVKGDKFSFCVDGKEFTGTIDHGVITLDGDLSKEPFFVLAVEKKYVHYQIMEEVK